MQAWEAREQKKQKELDDISQEVQRYNTMIETLMGQLQDQQEEWESHQHEDESFKDQAKMLSGEIHNICQQIDAVQKECHDLEKRTTDDENFEQVNDCIEEEMELSQLKTETEGAEQYYEDRHTECMENGDDFQ